MKKNILKSDLKSGIYCYKDKISKKIVYIGKDSDLIKNKRHYHHLAHKDKGNRHIDNVLRNAKDEFIYEQLLFCGKMNLDVIEQALIEKLIPTFNHEYIQGYRSASDKKLHYVNIFTNKYKVEREDMSKLINIIYNSIKT